MTLHFQYGQQEYVPNLKQFIFDVDLHCSNCPPTVRSILEGLKPHGVTQYQVSEFAQRTAVVEMDINRITPEQVGAKISEYTEAKIRQSERRQPGW